MALKQWIPWHAKIAMKVVFSRLPLRYQAWQRSGLFVHGAMDAPAYALRVVEAHVSRAGWRDLEDKTVLELGPGDSVATAVIARAMGAARSWLVDAGPFANRDLAVYRAVAALLAERGMNAPDLSGVDSLEALLETCRATYLTNGLEGLAAIPAGSVDLAFSQAVMEHVRLHEVNPTLAELRRVVAPEGVTTHQVDLKDHLGGALNHLRFSEATWEADWMSQSGFYTNRIRFADYVRRFEAAGFRCDVDDVRRWPALPTPRARLAEAFRALPDDDLRVSQFDIVGRPH